MDRFLLTLLSIIVLEALVCHAAASPAETYWQKVLPDSPMPKAILELLRPGTTADGTQLNLNSGEAVTRPYRYTALEQAGYIQQGYIHKRYRYTAATAAASGHIHGDPRDTLHFLGKDLHPGATMALQMTLPTPAATFLSPEVANSIPFSIAKFPEILAYFSIQSDSIKAKNMKTVLEDCEVRQEDEDGEYCATSLESMVDFGISSLGTRNIRALSTTRGAPKQQYTVTSFNSEGSMFSPCHRMPYPYPVFYCHTPRAANVYTVGLVGDDGTKVEAVAVCHTDTSTWNPNYHALRLLKVKPGTETVCHFVPDSDLVWIPSTQKSDS